MLTPPVRVHRLIAKDPLVEKKVKKLHICFYFLLNGERQLGNATLYEPAVNTSILYVPVCYQTSLITKSQTRLSQRLFTPFSICNFRLIKHQLYSSLNKNICLISQRQSFRDAILILFLGGPFFFAPQNDIISMMLKREKTKLNEVQRGVSRR